MEYVELLKAVLHEEKGHTREEAERLVKAYPLIVTQGIMAGNFTLRTVAMALEMAKAERESKDAPQPINEPPIH